MFVPPFLHVAPRPAIERQQTVIHLLASERHDDLSTLEGIADDLFLNPLRVLWRDCPVAERIVVIQGEPLKLLSGGELVFEHGDAWTAQRERLLAVAVVEQAISERQIEKLALPSFDAIPRGLGRLFGVISLRQQPEVRHWRQCRRGRLIGCVAWFGGIPSFAVARKGPDAGRTSCAQCRQP